MKTNPDLVRGIGRWGLLAICINTVIGAGIFVLPADAYKHAGAYSVVAFILGAVIIGAIALCYSEVASRYEQTGGMYLYAREAFGSLIGFQVGWLYWLVRVASFATNLLIFSELFRNLSFIGVDSQQSAGMDWLPLSLIAIISGMIIMVNLLGVKVSMFLTNIFTVSKLLPLIALVVLGFVFFGSWSFEFGPTPSLSKFTEAIVVVLYAYVGFEATLITAGEAKNPKKDMPFALIGSMIAIAVLFILIQWIVVGTVEGLKDSKAPLADSAGALLGNLDLGVGFDFAGLAVVVLSVGALISILGNLNAGFLAGSRLPFAMASQGEAPEAFAITHPKLKTPWLSILATGVAVIALAFVFERAVILKIAVMTRLLVYGVTVASVFVFRSRYGSEDAGLRIPGGGGLAVFSLLVIALLFADQINKSWDSIAKGEYMAGSGPIWMLGSLIVGCLIYALFRSRFRKV